MDLVSEGLKPKEADKNEGHKVMKFNVLQASVERIREIKYSFKL